MPAGPIGTSWADGSWLDTAWEDGSWAGEEAEPIDSIDIVTVTLELLTTVDVTFEV